MSGARTLYEPKIMRREKTDKPTVQPNVLSVNVIGTQPFVQLIVDASEATYVLKLDTALQNYIHRKLSEKLPKVTS